MMKELFLLLRIAASALIIVALNNSILHAQNSVICTVEVREYPGKDPYMWDALYAARNGTVYTGLITEGGSSHFYSYKASTDQNLMIADMAEFLGERSSSRPCQFYSYNPASGGYNDLGLLIVDRSPYYYWRGQQFDAMTTGTDGTVFIGESERRSHLFLFIP
jgi:hypothetical protein